MNTGIDQYDICPARVFVLIPEESDDAVIIRRGPATITGVYRWNVKTDQVESYQWLKGRIFEYFSDVSPDGKYLLYSANKKGCGYTVISRTPWIKAISYWQNVGGWGGGIFLGRNKYILYDGSDSYSEFISSDLKSVNRNSNQLTHGVYHDRLLRCGWKVKAQNESVSIFFKDIDGNTRLEKIWNRNVYTNQKGKGQFWEYHRLIRGSVSIEKVDWEWCEYLGDSLVWVEAGCLYRASLSSDDLSIKSILVYDFNPEKFRETRAPY
jgi:hypothetical protein